MTARTRLQSALVATIVAGALLVAPVAAGAQRRAAPRGPSSVRSFRSFVFVGGGFGFPRYYFYDSYDPFFYGYQWGPYWYPPYGPYGPYGYGFRDTLTASLRLQVKPREAQVFVDGYAAGIVDQYDGVFQRLHVRPGAHEITLFLQGYRTIRENVYLNPDGDQKIQLNMEPLAPGETSAPPPAPPENAGPNQPQSVPPGLRRGRPMPMPQGPPPQGAAPTGPPPVPPDQAGPPSESGASSNPAPEQTASFGSLSLRVQPSDAEILIDGQPWQAPRGEDRVAIQLADGRHHLEVQKNGMATFSEDVLIQAGRTLTLNVSLTTGGASAR